MPIVSAVLELSESDPKANNYNKFWRRKYRDKILVEIDTLFNKLNVRDLAAKVLAQFRFHTEKNQVTLQGSKCFFLHYYGDTTCGIKCMEKKKHGQTGKCLENHKFLKCLREEDLQEEINEAFFPFFIKIRLEKKTIIHSYYLCPNAWKPYLG